MTQAGDGLVGMAQSQQALPVFDRFRFHGFILALPGTHCYGGMSHRGLSFAHLKDQSAPEFIFEILGTLQGGAFSEKVQVRSFVPGETHLARVARNQGEFTLGRRALLTVPRLTPRPGSLIGSLCISIARSAGAGAVLARRFGFVTLFVSNSTFGLLMMVRWLSRPRTCK